MLQSFPVTAALRPHAVSSWASVELLHPFVSFWLGWEDSAEVCAGSRMWGWGSGRAMETGASFSISYVGILKG